MKYRLEFNESHQNWHYDRGTHKANTFGWCTIAEWEDERKLSIFTYWFDDIFYQNKNRKNKQYSSIFVKEQWKFFNAFYEYLIDHGADFTKYKYSLYYD